MKEDPFPRFDWYPAPDSELNTVTWHDPWRGRERTFRYTGNCSVCDRPTWSADDGENDPRGILGDHASHALVAEDYDMVGPDRPLCALCGNEEGPYSQTLRYAMRLSWRYKEEETA